MATANMTTLMNHIMKFRVKKKDFGPVWSDLSYFDGAKIVTPAGVLSSAADSTTTPLGGNTPKAVHALWAGKHFVGITEEGSVLIEYHGTREGVIEFVCYDPKKRTLKASVAMNLVREADGSMIFSGDDLAHMQYGSVKDPGYVSGVSLYLAFLVAGIFGLDPSTKDSSVEIAKALARLAGKSVEEEVALGVIDNFWTVSSEVYKSMKADGAYFSGVDTDKQKISGYLDFGTLYELTSGLQSAAYYAEVSPARCSEEAKEIIRACKFLDYEETAMMSVISSDTPSSAASYTSAPVVEGGMEKVKEDLKLDIHPLSKEEIEMIPEMGPSYVIDKKLLRVAEKLKRDWKRPGVQLAPNIILEGDAGSGKTAGSRFLASAFGIPYTKLTMSPTFESANLIGAFYPVYDSVEDWEDFDEKDKAALKMVTKTMGLSKMSADPAKDIYNAFMRPNMLDIVKEAYGLPDAIDCEVDPEGSWAKLGYTSDVPATGDIAKVVADLGNQKYARLLNFMVKNASQDKVSYRFVISELLKAFKYGWLVEIQEAASVLRPGVLTELNSLMEKGGRIELPNGQHITRHEDTIVVITTNRGYAGNVDINESLRDRCILGLQMDIPPARVMASRAMAQTGFDDADTAIKAAEIIEIISGEAKSKNIKGSFGFRSLLGWMLDLAAGDFSEESFRERVIDKMTTDPDDVSMLMTCYRANCSFASRVARSGRRA